MMQHQASVVQTTGAVMSRPSAAMQRSLTLPPRRKAIAPRLGNSLSRPATLRLGPSSTVRRVENQDTRRDAVSGNGTVKSGEGKLSLTLALSPRLIIARRSVGFSVNPKGIASSSPRLRVGELPWVLITPGRSNPNGVVAYRPTHGQNPVGVGRRMAGFPRVARASQPWALGRNPVGIHQICPRLVRNDKPGGKGPG